MINLNSKTNDKSKFIQPCNKKNVNKSKPGEQMKNKPGFTMVELLLSLVIFLSVLWIVGSFQTHLALHERNVKTTVEYHEEINNLIYDVHNEADWSSLENKEIKLRNAIVKVEFDYKGETEYDTNLLEIKTKIGKKEEILKLERSVHYGYKEQS